MKQAAIYLLTFGSIVNIGIFSFIMNVLLLVSPLYMLQVYDRVLTSANSSTLLYLSIAGVMALIFLGLLEIVRSIYSQRVAASIDRRLGSAAFSASLSGPRADGGDIQPLRDLATIRSYVASKGMAAPFDLPFAPLFIVLLYFIHPVLFWLTVAGVAVMILIVFLTQLFIARASAATTEQSASANLAAQSFARNGDTLRSMGIKRNAIEVWGRAFARSLDQWRVGRRFPLYSHAFAAGDARRWCVARSQGRNITHRMSPSLQVATGADCRYEKFDGGRRPLKATGPIR